MSELNTYHIPTRSGNSCLCYLKSEADKFISDLVESHKKEVGQLLMKIAELEKLVETADLLQARDYAESLNEDFDDTDGAHYTVGMIKENG